MAEHEPALVTQSSPGEPTPFERAKRQLLLSCLAIAGGIGIAGSLDRTAGGVILVVGWLLAIASLHRLGRSGSDRDGRKRGQ